MLDRLLDSGFFRPGVRAAVEAGRASSTESGRQTSEENSTISAFSLSGEGDEAVFSEAGIRAASEADAREDRRSAEEAEPEENRSVKESDESEGSSESSEKDDEEAPGELTEKEEKEVERLKERDREVRTHEQAHLAAAGGLANGGPQYEFEQGPDGKRYAVGGHVNIDVSPVEGDPQATIRRAEQIKRAALAPEEPSGKDRQVAAKADAMKAKAQAELAELNQEKLSDAGKIDSEPAGQTGSPSQQSGFGPNTDSGQYSENNFAAKVGDVYRRNGAAAGSVFSVSA